MSKKFRRIRWIQSHHHSTWVQKGVNQFSKLHIKETQKNTFTAHKNLLKSDNFPKYGETTQKTPIYLTNIWKIHSSHNNLSKTTLYRISFFRFGGIKMTRISTEKFFISTWSQTFFLFHSFCLLQRSRFGMFWMKIVWIFWWKNYFFRCAYACGFKEFYESLNCDSWNVDLRCVICIVKQAVGFEGRELNLRQESCTKWKTLDSLKHY